MDAKYVNTFLKSTQDIFSQVAQIDLKLSGTSLKNSPISSKNVVIMVGITGSLKGTVLINMDESLAMKIASNMMYGMPVTIFDEMAKSAICELSNMVMGNVATGLSAFGKNTDITPPTLMEGNNIKLTVSQLPLLSIKYRYEEYDLDFDISIKEN